METKHTPGPWKVVKARTVLHIQSNHSPICEISLTPHRHEELTKAAFAERESANARLIAAAPQLLEALANATATIKMLYGWEPIEAEKDKVRWEGPRKEMPEGFTEISNEAGVPPIVMKNLLEGYEKAIALGTGSEVAE